MRKIVLIVSLFTISLAACSFDGDGNVNPDAATAADAGADASVPLATACTVSADCGDGLTCTTDLCVCKDTQCQMRECQRIPDNGMCGMGETCVTGAYVGEGGCTPPEPMCPATCDDTFDCTVDSCGADDLRCHHQPQSSLCAASQTCDVTRGCVDPPMCPASCDDGYDCTVDNCTAGFACAHTKLDSACPSGQTCTATGAAGTGCTTPVMPPVPTITCKVVSAGIEYKITGGVRDHLYPDGGTVATPTFLEYGDAFDGWVLPYPAGSTKQKVAYAADLGTYVFTLNAGINDLNFFLTDTSDADGSDGAVGGKYFRLAEWTIANVANGAGVTSNCRLDAGGGGIIH